MSQTKSDSILVLCATGKVGGSVCKALKAAGFEVFGTTRSASSQLLANGIKPILCNYTVRQDLDRAFAETGAKKVFVITDYFRAAKGKSEVEIKHGKDAIDAAKAAGVEHLVFNSIADADLDEDIAHFKTKLVIEEYLKSSGVRYSILRPTCFFENFDAPEDWNPLKKGQLKFLTTSKNKYCSTYDIGRAAAIMFKTPAQWQGKTLDVVSWVGDLSEVATALEKVACIYL